MKRLRKKLKERRGASVLLALLVLLVVVMVSTVMLRAAVSNAGRVRSGEAEEQAYLTVSSAAALLREELTALGYSWQEADAVPAPADATLPLALLVRDMVQEIRGGSAQSSRTLTVELDGMDTVSVALTLNSAWSLQGELALAGENLRVNNYLTLSVPGMAETSGEGVTTLRFPAATIGKGGSRG